MKLSKARRNTTIAFQITPMIDIVFLLVIFFMTVSQITRTVDSPVELPAGVQGAAKTTPSTITINLDQHGQILMTGEAISLDECLEKVAQLTTKRQNDSTQRTAIQIRCDRNCTSASVNRLVERLAEQGIQQVKIAVSK